MSVAADGDLVSGWDIEIDQGLQVGQDALCLIYEHDGKLLMQLLLVLEVLY